MSQIIRAALALCLATVSACDFSMGGAYGGYSYGACDSYGQLCAGESYQDGAFEAVILPYAEYTYGVTVTVTFKDAANGEDVVQTEELYDNGYGEYWFYSPYAPPEGKVEIEAVVYVQMDYAIDAMCDDNAQADLLAYNNGYEVDVDYRGSSPCYAQADLRDVVD